MDSAKTPEEKADAFRQYAAAQVAIQQQMGVANENIHIITAETARKTVDHIMNSHDPKAEMMAMEKQYGQNWGMIFRDMAKIGGLPAKYEFLQILPDEDARVLGNALKQEAGVIKEGKRENPRNWEESLGPDPEGKPVKRTIDSLINSNQSMRDLQESMARRGINMLTQGIEVIDAVRSLAYGYKTGVGGKPAMDHVSAANKAVEAFVANYVFTRDKAMIPKENSDEIQKIMSFTRDSLTNMSTHIPGWAEKGPERGLPSQRDYLEAAKNGGYWVNTHDGDGVEYRDHNNRVMRYNDGKPVRLMFNDLSESRKRMNSTQYFQEPEAPMDASMGMAPHG